jgi:predicted anti-sigma-YlaC factor YlaD
MSDNLHTRAQQLLAQSLIEEITPADDAWLRKHLGDCPECREHAAATNDLLRALRAVPIDVPRDLAARTQMRVRLRAQETAGASRSGLVLWSLTAMSWLLGVMSAPLVWRAFAWIGEEFRVPKLALEMGFVLWWTIPALFAVAAVLHQRGVASNAKRF